MSHKPDLNGKYIFHSQENFDAFLAATGKLPSLELHVSTEYVIL